MTCSSRLCSVVIALVLAVVSFPGLTPSYAAQPMWLHTVRIGSGVRLTLSIRNRAYPQNALVRVWARMQNLTGHEIGLYDDGPQAAGKYIPQPVVRPQDGGRSLPISLTDYRPFPGPAPMALRLPAGEVHNIPEIVILRGPRVQLRLTLAGKEKVSVVARPARTLATPYVHLMLTAPDSPQVDLVTPPGTPSLHLTPPPGAHGKPMAVWNVVCGDGNPLENIDWTPVTAVITPTCSPLTGWHEIVGWLGHSVAQIDWGAQQE
jgi:hypothetical protein